ncbi:MAG TPA: hypothetical protein VJB18_07865 [Burkholderiales bacterium]|nr:hypothetical protein [Burkholderiales bacterium]
MGWLSDLLKEYPALSVAKERLALVEERFRLVEAENKKLGAENADLKKRLSVYEKASQFIEYKGVMWKQMGEAIDSIAYCPECKLAMSAFPPKSDEMLVCSKCNFTAPFLPSQVSEMARKLEIELLSA